MRVLITNSLVLAAISLAPSVAAAPYTTTSSVDSYDSYPNSTVPAQDSGPSSVPSVRRDEVIDIQSLYGGSSFENVFGPVAQLFGTIGMNTISDATSLTDLQKTVLGQLHSALDDAAGSAITLLPADHPLSPHSSRSLENPQAVKPLAILSSLPDLNVALDPLSELLLAAGIGPNPTTPLTDLQKQVVAKLRTTVGTAAEDIATALGLKVLPFGHQSRSVEERSLEDILSVVKAALSPVTSLINDLGVTKGTPLDAAEEQALAGLRTAVAKAAQDIESNLPSVHIEHAREEHDHNDHHEPHGDGHSRDDHDGNRKSQGVHEDGHRSPDAPHQDREVQSADREGDRCREPRDGQRDERHGWGWEHHEDGKGMDGEHSLLKINLGHSCHP